MKNKVKIIFHLQEDGPRQHQPERDGNRGYFYSCVSFDGSFVYFESLKEVAVDKSEKLTKHLAAYFFSNIENDIFDLFVPPKVDAIN